MKRGLLGGTFDPIHLGHLLVAEHVRDQLGLEEVCFIPTGRPWMKRDRELSGRDHRRAMSELAVASNPVFSVLSLELDRPGETYTVDTLEELSEGQASGDELVFILGVDSLRSLHLWRNPGRILELAALAVVGRPGYPAVDVGEIERVAPGASKRIVQVEGPMVGISGVDIRRRVAEGHSIRYLVPDAVAEYIAAHGLYGARMGGAREKVPDEGESGVAQRILEVAGEQGALLHGSFSLSSGMSSNYYFDGRMLSLSPEGASLVAKALLPMVRESGAEAIGGPTLGADPMVAAVAMASHEDGGRPIPGFVVRKESKEHGTGKLIEGPLPKKAKVAIVDDACSSGDSLFHAVRAAEAAGCTVVLVAALLDRRQGGSDRLRQEGYTFKAVLEADVQGNIAPARD